MAAGADSFPAWLSQCSAKPLPAHWEADALTHTLRAALCLAALLADSAMAKQQLLELKSQPPLMDTMAQTLQNFCSALAPGTIT